MQWYFKTRLLGDRHASSESQILGDCQIWIDYASYNHVDLSGDCGSMLAVGRDFPGSNPTSENFLFLKLCLEVGYCQVKRRDGRLGFILWLV